MARTLACNGWLTVDAPKKPSGEAAERGTAAHDYLHDVLTIGKEEARKKIAGRIKWGTWLRRLDVDALLLYVNETVHYSELAMKLNLKTEAAELLWHIENRDYPTDLESVYGTADLVIEGDVLEIIDFKSGQSVGPAQSDWQMKTLALLAARAFKQDEVRVKVFYLNEDGSIDVDDGDVFTAMDFDLIEHEIHTAIEAPATFSTSDYCRWCPANGLCELTASRLDAKEMTA